MMKTAQAASRQPAHSAEASSLLRPARTSFRADGKLSGMQSTHGNQRLQRMLNRGVLQAKLTINQPGDVFEQEADRVADHVMHVPDSHAAVEPNQAHAAQAVASVAASSSGGVSSSIRAFWSTQGSAVSTQGRAAFLQRACSCGGTCNDCKNNADVLQRTSDSSVEGGATAPPIVHEVLRSSGQPLDHATRNFMEPRFGSDFSQVRIHTDAKAAESARAVNAAAYTVGNDVVFASGRCTNSAAGRRLLAHELTHTVQQNTSGIMQRQPAPRKALVAPRFVGNAQLDRALNNELLIQKGSHGAAVRLIQESLLAQGYTLPQFGVDGDFGDETEAALKQFQGDAGAVTIDGVVGPETMGLLDQHDPTNVGGLGPPAKVGPVPGPRPAPAVGCDAPFTGVAFALANQVATGVAPAAIIGIGLNGGLPFLLMRGTAPANYQPHITIAAPTNAKAQEFEVGFISNLLTTQRDANFPGGHIVQTQAPAPIKDGAPLATGLYDAIFVQVPAAAVRENFTAAGATVNLDWPDTPGDGAFVNLPDNPACAALPASQMINMVMHDTFRTWVAVRHRPSGCVRTLHHIDWNLLWSANVTPGAPLPGVAVTSNVIDVTQPNGNGSPAFIQGGRVPGDVAHKACI
jgi:peptidoglycan hydrolase-like protein with peptidoglycan-binding domain